MALTIKVLSILLALSLARADDVHQIDLTPQACTAFEVSKLDSKFSYSATLLDVGDPLCDRRNISLSRFYSQEACVSSRDNEVGFGSVKINCPNAADSSADVCHKVFADGPSDALLTANHIDNGEVFDSGNVCRNQKTGFIYVWNQCPLPTSVKIKVDTGDYKGSGCLTVAGKSLSKTAVVIIVVATLIVLLSLLTFVCCCCCCCR